MYCIRNTFWPKRVFAFWIKYDMNISVSPKILANRPPWLLSFDSTHYCELWKWSERSEDDGGYRGDTMSPVSRVWWKCRLKWISRVSRVIRWECQEDGGGAGLVRLAGGPLQLHLCLRPGRHRIQLRGVLRDSTPRPERGPGPGRALHRRGAPGNDKQYLSPRSTIIQWTKVMIKW